MISISKPTRELWKLYPVLELNEICWRLAAASVKKDYPWDSNEGCHCNLLLFALPRSIILSVPCALQSLCIWCQFPPCWKQTSLPIWPFSGLMTWIFVLQGIYCVVCRYRNLIFFDNHFSLHFDRVFETRSICLTVFFWEGGSLPPLQWPPVL